MFSHVIHYLTIKWKISGTSQNVHSDVCPQTPELRHYKHMNISCDENYIIFCGLFWVSSIKLTF